MHITSITAKGLCGLNFAHQLERVTMIVGPNASGKTAVLRAIRLAILGYEPGVGDRADKVFQLCSGDSMSVAVLLGDKIIERSWRRAGDSIRSSQPKDPPKLPVVLLDASEFFGLSADKRTDYVFKRVKIDTEKFSAKAVNTRIKQLASAGMSKHHLDALDDLVNDFTFASQDVGVTQSLQEWIQNELNELESKNGKLATARANLDRMTKTMAGMTELDLKNVKELTESIPSLNTKISETEKELQELNIERDRLERLKAKIKGGDPIAESIALRTEINELEAKLESQVLLPDPSEAWGDAKGHWMTLVAEKDMLLDKLSVVREQAMAQEEKIAKKKAWQEEILSYEEKTSVIPDLKAQITELEPVVKGYVLKEYGAKFAVDSAKVGVTAVEDKIDAKQAEIEALDKELTKFLASDACPTCGAHDDGWKDVVKDHYADKIQSIKAQVEELEHAYGQVQKEFLDAKGRLLTAVAQDSDHLTRQNALHSLQNRLQEALLAQHKVEKLQSAINALEPVQDYSEAIAQCEANLKDLGDKAAAAEAKVKELEAAKREYTIQQEAIGRGKEVIAHLKAQLASLGSIIEEMKELDVDGVEGLQSDINLMAQAWTQAAIVRDDIKGRLAKALAYQQDMERHKQAEVERNKAEAKFETLKLVRNTLKEILGEIVAVAWGPILERANAIAGPILKTPLYVQDNVLGRMEGEKFVGTETFSGTEQAVTYAALCVALAQDSPFKLVMVDEMGRMDLKNKLAFLNNILELQRSGVIDQFVGVDVSGNDYEDRPSMKEVKVISL